MTVARITKESAAEKQAVSQEELAAINGYTMRELGAEEVFTFRLAACDNQIDRDNEKFSDAALEGLAALYPGKPVLLDHTWSAETQCARVYGAAVENDPARAGVRRLMLRCFVPRLDSTKAHIEAIETGLKRECSVGCAVKRRLCGLCGKDYWTECLHIKGQEYDGQMCYVVLDGAADAYEVSFVAVPAQREAGVVKSGETENADEKWKVVARAELAMEGIRYGAGAPLK